jgi:sugar lactone lactonase YvrE
MRLLPAVLLTSILSCSAFGQSYTISTFAGGERVNTAGTSTSVWPRAIALDPAGNVFFVNQNVLPQNTVLRWDAVTGIVALVAGNGSAGFSGDNGPATSAQLSGPDGLAVDSAGNLYIADTGNQRVRKVSNGVIITVAGNGATGSSGEGVAATAAC